MKAFQYVMIFFCFSVISLSSHAEQTTVEFTATVNSVNDNANVLGSNIKQGDIITGSYTIDLAVPDSDPNPENGDYRIYPPLATGLGFTLNLPNFTYTPNNTTDLSVNVINDAYNDYYTVQQCCGQVGTLSNGTNIENIVFDLYDPAGTTLSQADINTDLTTLNAFPEKHLNIAGYDGATGNWFNIDATITNLGAPVAQCEPQPAPVGANTLYYTATITSINPSHVSNLLGVNVGDPLSGKFMINPNAPDLDPNIDIARFDYEPGDPVGNVEVTLGGVTMTGNPDAHSYNMYIGNSAAGYGSDDVNISVWGNSLTFSNDAWFDGVDLSFHDPNGVALNVASIPESLPTSIAPWGERDIILNGSVIDGSPVTIIATVDSIEHNLVLPEAPEQISISPGSGFVVNQQVFETGIVVDETLPPIGYYTVTLSVNDMVHDVTSYCRPPQVLSSKHQYIECGPTINNMLEPGKNTLKVDIDFVDKTLTQEVVWEFLQNP